ncbi:Inner membrane protein ybjM [Citrobacter koseri]|nr:inner membrane protein YbjM [Citrobacter koseri]SUX65897.1 Inner membrane protein ybjM [Citrobacter koseri]
MKHKQSWAGAICCFVLFIVVCLSLTMHMKGAFRVAGHPEIGLLFFTLPGAVASFFSHRREVIKPLIGAMLAAPCCLVLMRFVFMPTRSVWQETGVVVQCGVLVCARRALLFIYQQPV